MGRDRSRFHSMRIHRQIKMGVDNQHIDRFIGSIRFKVQRGSVYTIVPSRSTPARPRIDTIVSRTVHVATVCGTLMLKYSLTSQNPPSFTWLAMSDPAPIATTRRSLLTPGIEATIGVMMLAAVTQATVADPTDTRSRAAITQPSTIGERLQAAHRLRNRRVDACCIEHAAEPAAGTDHQQDAGDSGNRLLGKAQQPLAVEPAGGPERVKRQERGEQHRDERAAGKADPLAQGTIGQRRLRQRRQEHEQHRQQDRQQRDRERGQTGRGHLPAQLVRHRPGLYIDSPADEPAKERARHQGDGKADDERIEQRAAGVGTELRDGCQRTGMRRHEAVRDRKPGDERDGQP